MENQPLPPTEYDRILTVQLFESEAREVVAALSNTLGEPRDVREMRLLRSARDRIASRMQHEWTE